ncbi:hypothetical protein SAMN06296056_101928 [Priestia filamentosa]|nr:hypothetical protein SAMN06296056_101928 [Priestia filamentosa]
MVHAMITRWMQQYGPELEERVRLHHKSTNYSWRGVEIHIKVKKAMDILISYRLFRRTHHWFLST